MMSRYRRWISVGGLAVLLLVLLSGMNRAQAEYTNRTMVGGTAHAKDEVLVKFKDVPPSAHRAPLTGAQLDRYVANLPGAAKATLQQVGGQALTAFPRIKVVHVKISPNITVQQAIEHLQASGTVEYAEPNHVVHATQATPLDPYFKNQWGLNNTGQKIQKVTGVVNADIDAPEAWATRTDGSATIVVLIDTGVRYNHADLAANMWKNPQELAGKKKVDDDGFGVVDDLYGIRVLTNSAGTKTTITGNPMDDNGHGTHCAGIIGAAGNNKRGVCGVNWKARIMALKFLDRTGTGWVSDAVACINYALYIKDKEQYPRMVMSNSWGGGSYDQTMRDAIAAARDAGVLFVAAAGNSGTNNDSTPFYPAAYKVDGNNQPLDNIISVGASDNTDQPPVWSNFGATSVHLFAPGVNIYSTFRGSYGYMSGTSMACPHVSGAAALLWSKPENQGLTYAQIKDLILNGVDKKDAFTQSISGGRLNLNNSLNLTTP